MSQKERQRYHLMKMVMRFLKAYMVDIGEFLKQTGYMPPNVEPIRESKRIPIISWTQAGSWQENIVFQKQP